MTPMGAVWRVLVALAGIAFGIASVRVGLPSWNVVAWLGDLLTGWAIIAVGLVGTGRPESRRIGVLITLAGFAWFIGDWAVLGGPAGEAAAVATFLHRGFVFHAIFTSPSGRSGSMAERIAVPAGYAASLVPWIWSNAVPATVAAMLVVGAGALVFIGSPGLLRRTKRRSLEASALLAGAIIGGFVIRAAWEAPAAASVALAIYEVTLVLTAGSLVVSSRLAARSDVGADLVVELGSVPGGSLEQALRWALGDPLLRLGYPTGVAGEFRDPRGDLLGSGVPELTIVHTGGEEVAAIEAAPGALADPALLESVTTAIRLDAANRALRADVAEQIEAVRASQRRIIRAGDEESRRIAKRLDAGAGARLRELSAAISSAAAQAVSASTAAGLDEVRSSLARASEDLEGLARGLHPRPLDESGLAGALASAARDAPLSVEVSVEDGLELPSEVELAVYYFCLEGLTNIVKHADATRASITIRRAPDVLHVEIIDDGVAGAAVVAGGGLGGVADRITALGGSVDLASRPGLGTRLSAELPVRSRPFSRSAPTDAS